MAGTLDAADVSRVERMGVQPLPTELGLELFDQAHRHDVALLVPVRLDLGALRAQARAGMLPPLLRGLVRAPARRVEAEVSLAQRLAGVPEDERERVVLQLVQAQVAAVLGHSSPAAVDAQRAFRDFGFDSLAAVDLRNRLTRASGVRLPSTLVFDHPTAAAVATFLLAEVGGIATEAPVDQELRRLEDVLASVAGSDRRRVAGRLRKLLVALDAEEGQHTSQRIEAATTADEVFQLIDAELGTV
jgi:acyl carrier protein